MQLTITTEKRGEIEQIQRDFRRYLSPEEILRGTAQGVNSTLARAIPRINKAIKAEYNITQKYLSRQAVVSPKASIYRLYGGIRINESRLPIVAFRPRQKGGSVAVAIHKGKTVMVRNAFIATMPSGHTGVFSRGRYVRSGFQYGRERTASGKVRITERVTTSPLRMAISPEVRADVAAFIEREAAARVQGILISRVKKIGG